VADFLTPDVVSAIRSHMNNDHADDNVTICRGVGGHAEVTAATVAGLDLDAVEFEAHGPAGRFTIRIPFSAPLTERADVRAELARMVHES
jgi:putative heme iron utilization protein